ncbi:MAG: HisA/HisF-related TIM barrel protein [Gemmatimonadota bacterium]|nr:HisA/HisF-related TIM barrel protein [Gemmatimonadota bacterium]
MIVPSIDLMDGQAVQLVQGRRKVLEAGDPRSIAERFGRVGEVAVVDLDAALGRGSNAGVIEELCRLAPCRVGGGIRDRDAALRWLDRGAAKVVLGTAAVPEVLEALPRERVVAALDAWNGEVVVKGWTRRTGRTVLEGMRELRGLACGFLVTFVEGEGKEGGFPRDRVGALVAEAGSSRLTIAGGITTPEEIAWLDGAGADGQVGMALYRGTLGLAEAFTAPLRSERPDGLWPTVVTDDRGAALGLVWSSLESVRTAIDEGRGVYHSRSRGLWRKGASSGATQDLLRVEPDCDRDALRFTVSQRGAGFCHTGEWTCFGPGEGLRRLERTVNSRRETVVPGSLTGRLLADPAFLRGKLVEEAAELADAVVQLGEAMGERAGAGTGMGEQDIASARPDDGMAERDAGPGRQRVVEEAADVMYFLTVALEHAGVSLADVERELDRRSMKVRRRQASAPKGAASE